MVVPFDGRSVTPFMGSISIQPPAPSNTTTSANATSPSVSSPSNPNLTTSSAGHLSPPVDPSLAISVRSEDLAKENPPPPATAAAPKSGSTLSAPPSKSAAHQFHGALALAPHPFEEGFSQMLGFHHHHLHHHQNPNILTADQIADAISTGGGESTENYMRKRYREDLFKDENQNQGETNVGSSSSPSNKQFKSAMEIPKQQEAGPSSGNNILRHHANMMPATAHTMWAVAPAPTAATGAGNTLWMLPVSTTVGTSSSHHESQPHHQQMWPFPAAQAVGGGNTLQAPLHFLPRINLPEFQQNSRTNPLQLGSMLMQQQPSQHLGLGMSEDFEADFDVEWLNFHKIESKKLKRFDRKGW
ncbi:hypothetical protein L1987_32080 [Smallanthus sonchifolius]|uniref:Uncharacterized protein n=1 Tax=Smallanthus sonchifolius TaxID=185202 RepID=A0ACB9I982_9ASTR|nr:hypothetical protein L1987_32080 [Smallanthus sonchifolius]